MTQVLQLITMDDEDIIALQQAKQTLENPGLAAKITNTIGSPIEKALDSLPEHWNKRISDITQLALGKAINVATSSINHQSTEAPSNRWHKLAVATTGGVGGTFGLTALAVELPVSTTIMLRSIADIARSEGEDITSLETKMACMEVFALGGHSEDDDGTESGYFAVRAALAQTVKHSVDYVVTKGLIEDGAPMLIQLIIKVANRFSVQVSQKAAAQLLPAIGAAGGATINLMFIDHFQDMARGHFVVRRLERKYGNALVESTYRSLQPSVGVSN